jgi:hypothetical protein
MRIIPDQLHSQNLVPFKKRRNGYSIPGGPNEEDLNNRVDTDLNPEEQSFVRHYLGYADLFLKSAEETVTQEPEAAGAPEAEVVPPSAEAAEKPAPVNPPEKAA